jgi:uncharacterized membrane protein
MKPARLLMGALYIAAGVGHFIVTRVYMGIMPDYLPAHRELVLISGAAEIAGGLGVLIPATRRPDPPRLAAQQRGDWSFCSSW